MKLKLIHIGLILRRGRISRHFPYTCTNCIYITLYLLTVRRSFLSRSVICSTVRHSVIQNKIRNSAACVYDLIHIDLHTFRALNRRVFHYGSCSAGQVRINNLYTLHRSINADNGSRLSHSHHGRNILRITILIYAVLIPVNLVLFAVTRFTCPSDLRFIVFGKLFKTTIWIHLLQIFAAHIIKGHVRICLICLIPVVVSLQNAVRFTCTV